MAGVAMNARVRNVLLLAAAMEGVLQGLAHVILATLVQLAVNKVVKICARAMETVTPQAGNAHAT
jgi:hypothetical protein